MRTWYDELSLRISTCVLCKTDSARSSKIAGIDAASRRPRHTRALSFGARQSKGISPARMPPPGAQVKKKMRILRKWPTKVRPALMGGETVAVWDHAGRDAAAAARELKNCKKGTQFFAAGPGLNQAAVSSFSP
jgi:hypothetical protein